MITPNGRYLGRRPDTHDHRDRHFSAAHPEAAAVQLPPSVDLRHKPTPEMPPCYDQGDLSSCGGNMGAALMRFFYPNVDAFSRLQIYYDARKYDGETHEDSGVQTRNILKALSEHGAAPETEWPYDVKKFASRPPVQAYQDAGKYKLSSYSRLTSGSNYLQCLASGYPFCLGIELFESFDSDQLDKTGIMVPPQPSEKDIGGHDVLVVGYILNFKSDPLFKQSGIDPALASDEVLMIRNSWGTNWSRKYRGHFFMPLAYALDNITGNDAWSGRK